MKPIFDLDIEIVKMKPPYKVAFNVKPNKVKKVKK